MIASPERRSVTGPTRTSGVAPISLPELARRTAELWAAEPQVPAAQRAELLTELHELEHDIEHLRLRSTAGLDVQHHLVKRCAERFLWLREQWGHDEVAA